MGPVQEYLIFSFSIGRKQEIRRVGVGGAKVKCGGGIVRLISHPGPARPGQAQPSIPGPSALSWYQKVQMVATPLPH